MSKDSTYEIRGVSASKDEVHNAIKDLDKGIFPNAFCKVIPDVVGGDKEYCNIMHADTAGTKTSLAYMYWAETGDISVWKGIVEDALVMNLDDMACIGCLNNIVLSSTIGRNKSLISGDVLKEIITHTQTYIDELQNFGIDIFHSGGETADVGDIVRTIDVGFTTFARMPRRDVISIDIQPGDVIVGLSSSGQTKWEKYYNGGMGSNGLTSARHDVFHHSYAAKYPETYNPSIPNDFVFSGSKLLTDSINISDSMAIEVGKLVLSPTRTYMPVLKPLIAAFKDRISGIIHCSGGGQTKVSKFMSNHTTLIKNNLFDLPPLFQIIRDESGLNYKEMYQVFNMGHRMELYVKSVSAASEMIDMCKEFDLDAQIIGEVIKSPNQKRIIITSPESEEIEYKFE
ncbi:MAG: AIR synthase-related protein [Saprospiraceae bacterium]